MMPTYVRPEYDGRDEEDTTDGTSEHSESEGEIECSIVGPRNYASLSPEDETTRRRLMLLGVCKDSDRYL